jgi:DNA-binding winged helix-turn-helix (wHTH) protein/TolB-like protein/Tfp pilus assembly protein PilF
MATTRNNRLRFGDFELDREAGKLLREGQPVKIQPQPLRVLDILVQRPGQTISREELRSYIWNNSTFVEFDQGLNYCIRQIRLALHDNAADPEYVETLPKQGYRFIADVHVSSNGGTLESGEENAAPEPIVTEPAPSQDLVDPGPVYRNWRRRRRFKWSVAAGLGILIAIAATFAYLTLRRQPAASREPISLAILPIANHTGNQSLNYVADGLTDDLIRQLSQVPALRLMGRTTMFRYRDRTARAEAIAKALHVNTVMTGELRRTPEHTSLAVEVTNAGDGSIVLDREYIADARDLRTVQADLQRDMLARLHVEGSARDPGRLLQSVTSNADAYQEFLQGDTLARTAAPADIHQAILHFEKAVALDPKFDLAWSSLASGHLFLGIYFEPPREQIPPARKCAERALQMNPSLGEAHGSLGLIHLLYDWDLPAAEAEMSTAGAEAAAIGTLACTVHLIESAGKPRNAEEMLRRMLAYDPQSSALIAELGCVDFYRGDYDAALRHYRDALQSDPQTPVAYWGMGKTLNAQGKHAEAIKVLRSFKERNGFEPPLLTAEIGYALGASGQREQALEIIRNLSRNPGAGFIDPYYVSIVYLSIKDRDAAFRWLNKSLDVRSSFAISILTEPKWQPFRSDPRFALAVQRMLTSKT